MVLHAHAQHFGEVDQFCTAYNHTTKAQFCANPRSEVSDAEQGRHCSILMRILTSNTTSAATFCNCNHRNPVHSTAATRFANALPMPRVLSQNILNLYSSKHRHKNQCNVAYADCCSTAVLMGCRRVQKLLLGRLAVHEIAFCIFSSQCCLLSY